MEYIMMPTSRRRLKATLERLQRMTQQYVDGLLSLFSQRADSIGHALGLEPERIQVVRCAAGTLKSSSKLLAPTVSCCATDQVFSEAEIRASVVFQLSELVNTLLKASRTAIGGSEWDALVAGGGLPTRFDLTLLPCAPCCLIPWHPAGCTLTG